MKTILSVYYGSKRNHETAYSIRQQADGLYAVFHGSKPIKKDIPNQMAALNRVMYEMGIWKKI